MEWSGENYIATYFPQFPTFIRLKRRGRRKGGVDLEAAAVKWNEEWAVYR
jgi:hypothetical protein